MDRKANIRRKTKETEITIELNLDGSGKAQISTPIPFMNHMLELLAKHGLFDLKIQAKGDIKVDAHHTVEDLGICLGEVFKSAMSDKVGIVRYGQASIPMDESLAAVNVDFGGRPFLVYNVKGKGLIGDFDADLIEGFFQAFASSSAANIHVNVMYGNNLHHIIEAIFKAFAKAVERATRKEPRIKGVLSTKGVL